jgi:hypothetical protein
LTGLRVRRVNDCLGPNESCPYNLILTSVRSVADIHGAVLTAGLSSDYLVAGFDLKILSDIDINFWWFAFVLKQID